MVWGRLSPPAHARPPANWPGYPTQPGYIFFFLTGEPGIRAERMRKLCPVCESPFQSTTPAKFCSEACREARKEEGHSPLQRWAALLRVLDEERVPENDLLRRENYYFELIADGKCHYCQGPLSRTGFALDRLDNTKRHFCWNAIIPACGRCNSTRSDLYSFKQFSLFRPVLEKIRREETKEGR